jgi:APA family basic amino acid/polyamine antiporter
LTELKRELGLFDSTMIVVGNMIGIGLYIAPGFSAVHVESVGYFFLAWMIGAVYSFAGAVTFSELGIRFPRAGGDYVFLRESYGPLFGFLTGWVSVWITFTGSIAALSVGLSRYLGTFFPRFFSESPWTVVEGFGRSFEIGPHQVLAVAILWLLTLNLCRGIRPGARFQNVFSMTKVVLLTLLCGAGFLFGNVDWGYIESWSRGPQTVTGLGLALIPILFTYSGWNAITYVAGEVKHPETTIPRSLVIGTGVVVLVYFSVNLIYVVSVPAEGIRGNILLAATAAGNLFGPGWAYWINGVIVVSITSALNSTILLGSRISYAMAHDLVFIPALARLHPTRHTPHRSLLFQASWASVLVFSGSFEQLLTFVVFGILVLSALTASSVFWFRRRDRTGPGSVSHPGVDFALNLRFRGIPLFPGFYILFCAGLIGNTLWQETGRSLIGIFFILLGTPVYWFYRNRIKGEGP